MKNKNSENFQTYLYELVKNTLEIIKFFKNCRYNSVKL